ncbi:MAG: PilZ domain-containing protein [Burkholderiaceae bacterium]
MSTSTTTTASSTQTLPLTPTAGAAAAAAPRPTVLSLSIKEKSALAAAYMPFIRGGGLFVPTTRPARLGDDIYALISLIDDPTKLPIPGKVIWITPAGTPGRAQGIGIQFADNEAGEAARARIEGLIGGVSKGTRVSHTI